MAGTYRWAALCCAAAIACTKADDRKGQGSGSAPPAPTPTPTAAADAAAPAPTGAQWYRAVLAPEGGPEIPFFVELPRGGGTGKTLTGRREEDVVVRWSGGDVTIEAPLFHTSMVAHADAKGALTGEWRIDSRTWGQATVPLRAAPVDSPAPETRFDEATLPGAPIDLGGKTTFWRATFPESGVAKLQLNEIAPGSFDGTIAFDTGNTAYFAGNARGGKLRLSCLGGLSIYILTADIDPKAGTITGTWMSGPKLAWKEKFTAKRGPDFPIKVTVKTTKPGAKLAMPSLARYKGKPLIVEFGGSWCDTCKYAAPVLRAIHERYRDKGLEVVTFTYEFTEDSEYNKQAAAAFKAAYELPWDVIPIDAEPEDVGKTMPEALDGIDASGFPITVFVHRDDRIESVHASFAGPENPTGHQRHIDAFDRAAAAIAK